MRSIFLLEAVMPLIISLLDLKTPLAAVWIGYLVDLAQDCKAKTGRTRLDPVGVICYFVFPRLYKFSINNLISLLTILNSNFKILNILINEIVTNDKII